MPLNSPRGPCSASVYKYGLIHLLMLSDVALKTSKEGTDTETQGTRSDFAIRPRSKERQGDTQEKLQHRSVLQAVSVLPRNI